MTARQAPLTLREMAEAVEFAAMEAQGPSCAALRATAALIRAVERGDGKLVQREPTVAMLRVNVGNPFNGDQPSSGCLLGAIWRAMYDAAPRGRDG